MADLIFIFIAAFGGSFLGAWLYEKIRVKRECDKLQSKSDFYWF